MKLRITYASGVSYGDWQVDQYEMEVVRTAKSRVEVVFKYPYQGARFQRASEKSPGGILMSELPKVGLLRLRNVDGMRWLAKALLKAADEFENSHDSCASRSGLVDDRRASG